MFTTLVSWISQSYSKAPTFITGNYALAKNTSPARLAEAASLVIKGRATAERLQVFGNYKHAGFVQISGRHRRNTCQPA